MFHYKASVTVSQALSMVEQGLVLAALPAHNFVVCSEVKLTPIAVGLFIKTELGVLLADNKELNYTDVVEYNDSLWDIKRGYYLDGEYNHDILLTIKVEPEEYTVVPLDFESKQHFIKAEGMDVLRYMFFTSEEGSDFTTGSPLWFDAQFNAVGQEGSDVDYNCMISGSLTYNSLSGNFECAIGSGTAEEDKEKAFKCLFDFPKVQVWLKALMIYIAEHNVKYKGHEFGLYPCEVQNCLPSNENAKVIGFEITN